MIPGIAPIIIRKRSASPSGYSFTMVAGEEEVFPGSGIFVAGYYAVIDMGEIDVEPVPGKELSFALTFPVEIDAISAIGYEEEVAEIHGLVPWINGVNVGFSPFSTNDEGATGSVVDAAIFSFVKDQSYFIEFK